jgi:outer membrane biosynthesis protein TonB
MSSATLSFRHSTLAWSVSPDDLARLRKIEWRVGSVAVLVAVLAHFIPLPERALDPAPTLPVPMAQLLKDKPAVVLPTPPVVKARPVAAIPAPTVAPQAAPAAKPKPAPMGVDKPKEAAVTPARQPVEGKPPGEALDAARRKATGVGLLAMKDQLAELQDAPTAVQLNKPVKPGPGVGTGTGPGVGAGTEAGLPSRALITAGAGQGSGGINTASYSRDTGGGGLAGRATTLVAGVAGGGGGGGPGGGGGKGKGNGLGNGTGTGAEGSGGNGAVQRGGSGKAARSLEDIRLVFERNKGAIYAIYNRALREDPALQGKVVLELKIAPAGHVQGLRIVSSELHAAELEQKLLARIRQFDFGAKDVADMVVSWPLDFLPS